MTPEPALRRGFLFGRPHSTRVQNRDIRWLSECRQSGMKLARDGRRRTDRTPSATAPDLSSRSRRLPLAMS
ncbi:hypothetical protein SMJ63A_120079 [Stenotrophomonas geniculata]